MSIFAKLKEQQIGSTEEQFKDLGGASFISESGVYSLNIKRAWAIESKGGAIGIHVEFGGDHMLDMDIYMTNKEGETYYVAPDGKSRNMKGYLDVKKINYIATGKLLASLADIPTAERIVKAKVLTETPDGTYERVEKEIKVDYLIEWDSKPITICVQQVEALDKEKNLVIKKDGSVATNLELVNVYNSNGFSASELFKGEQEPKALEKDLERVTKTPIKKAKQSKSASSGATATKQNILSGLL